MPKLTIVPCENCSHQKDSIFCSLERSSLEGLSRHKVMNNYKRGHTIFFQGNPPFGLYCINEGKIKIAKIGNDGKESIIRIAGPGDVIGHRSLLGKENYTATATVIEDASVCFIDKKHITDVIYEKPELALKVIEKLSKEMGQAEARNASMSQKNVCERLAELLLSLKKKYGIKEDHGWKLDIKLTREEMAALIGTANETVIRTISDFKNEGILDQIGKTIYITDEKKLASFANLN